VQKREIKWLVALAVLAGFYYYIFHTRFAARPVMTINASPRPARRAGATVLPIFFTLNTDFRLTSVEVLPLEGTKFNPHALPVWHLISDSNSLPTRAFIYGQPIRGMKPAVAGTRPDQLTPGTAYRILVAAGKLTASRDFTAQAPSQTSD
jgi:hypothetical protein